MRTMDLYCNLTEQEEHQKGQRVAAIDGEVEQLRDEMKHQSSAFKTQIESLESEAHRLNRQIREHKEQRKVEVEDKHDLERLVVETIRKDTGAIVESRPMTGPEREKAVQPELPLGTNLTPKCRGGFAGCDHHDDPASECPGCSECGADCCPAHGHSGGDDDNERNCSLRGNALKATIEERQAAKGESAPVVATETAETAGEGDDLEQASDHDVEASSPHPNAFDTSDADEPITVVEGPPKNGKAKRKAKAEPVADFTPEPEESDEDEPMQAVD